MRRGILSRIYKRGIYIQFKRDVTFDLALGDWVEDHPNMQGEFWFEGTQLNWKDVKAAVFEWEGAMGWSACLDSNPTNIYEAQLLANGNLKVVRTEDKCPSRLRVLHETEGKPIRQAATRPSQ